MEINPKYEAASLLEYGLKVLPYQTKEMKEAYLEDIRSRFTRIAQENESKELKEVYDNLKYADEYVSSLANQLQVLVEEKEDITDKEEFIRRALRKVEAERVLYQLEATKETIQCALEEVNKSLFPKMPEQKKYVPKI